ncbi:MAG: nuclear transport factor 2 family protein, partial [Pseudomonadales bacterium]
MTDLNDVALQVQALVDYEAIKTLKHRYIRCMTQSRWDEMASLLTEDVECAYSDGKYTFNNREELMQFLRASHDATESMTIGYWHVTMPEISLTTDTTASGKWGMYHFFLNKAENQQLEMFSYYDDEYVKI